MTQNLTTPITLPLWPDTPPNALGDGPDDRPTLTLYLPHGHDAQTQPQRPGLVIVLPGGGYHFKAAHEGEPIARWLNDAGIPAAVVQYRVAPYRHPTPSDDARRAIRLARHHAQEWGIDPTHIAILGFSAGGHCAATTATIQQPHCPYRLDDADTLPSRPDALILCYPVITFGPLRHDGSMHCLLDDADGHVDPDLQRQLSLENSVTDANPPTFIWSTFTDQAVPIQNSLMFAAALHDHHVPCELHIFPEGHHGLGLATETPGVRQWTALCADWLARQGFLPGAH